MVFRSKHDVVNWAFDNFEQCASLADMIAAKHDIFAHHAQLVGMNMAHHSLTMCAELLSFYFETWDQMKHPAYVQIVPSHLAKERDERVMGILGMTFVATLSALEAAAKAALELPGCPRLTKQGSRVYLGGIMAASDRAGIIDEIDANFWRAVVRLRNCLVHNNGIADGDMLVPLHDGTSMQMFAGAMTRSSPRQNSVLIKGVILAYSRWCDSLLSCLKQTPQPTSAASCP